jgi:hypothetical protein
VASTPPQGHFAQTPGSGSGPAIAAPPIVSTRHGYASGGAMSMPGTAPVGSGDYQRFQSQTGDDLDIQLRPSRRALFIGVAVLIAGVVLVVSLVVGGSKDEAMTPSTGSDTAGSDTTGSASAVAPAPSADEYIAVHVVSDPKGADVIIAGTKVGVTPFDRKLKRGLTVTQLVVRMAGYADFTAKVDLGLSEYANEKVKLVKLPDKTETVPDKTVPDKTGPDTGPDKSEPDKTGQTGPDKTGPDKTGPDKTGPDKTGPDKTGPDKTGQTGPDKTHTPPIVHNPIHNPVHNPTTTHTTDHTTVPTHTHPNGGGGDHTTEHPATPTPKEPPKLKCQPAGSINPFDTSCDGKACPVCK